MRSRGSGGQPPERVCRFVHLASIGALPASVDGAAAVSKISPHSVPVGDHPTLIQHTRQQERRTGVNSIKSRDVDLAPSHIAETIGQSDAPDWGVVGEMDQKVEVRGRVLVAAGNRAIEDREPHPAFGAKRLAKSGQEIPVRPQVPLLAGIQVDSPRPGTPAADHALRRRPAQSALVRAEVGCQILKGAHRCDSSASMCPLHAHYHA